MECCFSKKIGTVLNAILFNQFAFKLIVHKKLKNKKLKKAYPFGSSSNFKNRAYDIGDQAHAFVSVFE